MLYRALRRFTILKAAVGLEPFHLVETHEATEFHGSSYGGWAIRAGSLGSDSIVISAGLGEDVSFDLSLLATYGCRVHGFDPTPRAVAWARAHVTDQRFTLHEVALADVDGRIRFALPTAASADGVSASAVVAAPGAASIEVPCTTLGGALAASGGRCDLLKLDIEGAEYAVLAQALEAGWLADVPQLLVEFHHWLPGIGAAATRRCVAGLRAAGYRIAWISRTNHEYLFVRPLVTARLAAAAAS